MDYNKISELLEVLNLAKIGASKDVIPMYCQYVCIEDNKIITCSEDTFVALNYSMPFDFEGCINIFVFIDILKSINKVGVEVNIKVEDDKLVISTDSYETRIPYLNKETLNFPIQEKMDIQENYIEIDNELLYILELAKLFTGANKYSYIAIDQNGVCSTDTSRVFLNSKSLNQVQKIIKIDKKVFLMLESGCHIGVDENNNIVVERKDGYMIFTTDLEEYPIDEIRQFSYDKINSAINKVCNFAVLSDSIQKLTPILQGESKSRIDLINENNKLIITSDSQFNGTTKLEYKTKCDKECMITLDLKYLRNIPISFDTYMKEGRSDFISLRDEAINSHILILGEDVE